MENKEKNTSTKKQSMKKRGIILPSAIRNEFVMLYAEQQNKPQR